MSDALAARAAGQQDPSARAVVSVDPATGLRLERVPKSPSVYARQGRLFSAVLNDREGYPIIKEDKDAYYIPAAPEPSPVPNTSGVRQPSDDVVRERLIDIPAEEAEKVTPPRSGRKLTLVEKSEGLPTTGMWRENFALADLDGDGRPEIVSPPPRLSGKPIQVFKLTGEKWQEVSAQFEDPENLGFEYGGVAVGDIDGDGRADIVFGKHGGGPAVAYNLGGYRFRVESRGLLKQMSTRSMEIGDLDGDGKPDILALSDEPEYLDVRTREAGGDFSARSPRPDGSIAGFDTRAFLQRDGRFQEASTGLGESCFGYSISLYTPKKTGEKPFFVTSCRYQGDAEVIYTFDRGAKKFSPAGLAVTERYSAHLGTAVGTYKGYPAGFVTYIKNGPEGALVKISGNGVSVYYETPDGWQRKRILKTIEQPVVSQGIAVGDLDGDGLDDVVFADDSTHRLRVFFQTTDGGFEELAAEREPALVNHTTAIRIGDVNGDGHPDIVLMYQYLTGDATKAGGFRVFQVQP